MNRLLLIKLLLQLQIQACCEPIRATRFPLRNSLGLLNEKIKRMVTIQIQASFAVTV